MRPTMLLAVLLGLMAAGCGPDPIIGRWSMTQSGMEMIVEFKPDGTGAIDTTAMEAALRARIAGNPGAAALGESLIQTTLQKLRETRITWKKEGAVYRTEGRGAFPGGSSGAPSYLKLEGTQLVPCDKDGKKRSGAAFTRKT